MSQKVRMENESVVYNIKDHAEETHWRAQSKQSDLVQVITWKRRMMIMPIVNWLDS